MLSAIFLVDFFRANVFSGANNFIENGINLNLKLSKRFEKDNFLKTKEEFRYAFYNKN